MKISCMCTLRMLMVPLRNNKYWLAVSPDTDKVRRVLQTLGIIEKSSAGTMYNKNLYKTLQVFDSCSFLLFTLLQTSGTLKYSLQTIEVYLKLSWRLWGFVLHRLGILGSPSDTLGMFNICLFFEISFRQILGMLESCASPRVSCKRYWCFPAVFFILFLT